MSAAPIGPDHYRYSSQRYLGRLEVDCERFICIGETPKCFYVLSEIYAEHLDNDTEYSKGIIAKCKRLVLKDSRIRYCYPTKQEALNSFLARQRKRAQYAQLELDIANLAIKMLDTEEHRLNPPNQLTCGSIRSTQSFSFEEL